MLQTKLQGNRPLGFQRRRFCHVFTINGCGGHLFHVTQIPKTIFSLSETCNSALMGKLIFEEMSENK